jgi:mono/diheme cytochrome c family protein
MMRILMLSIVVFGAAFGASSDDRKAIPKSPARPPASSSSGGKMYHAYCAACHGPLGKGDGPASSALKSAPTDLTQLAKRNSGKFPELQVFGAIDGDLQVPAHGSKEMPVWGAVFRRMGDNSVSGATLRIRNLTRYIESLQEGNQ